MAVVSAFRYAPEMAKKTPRKRPSATAPKIYPNRINELVRAHGLTYATLGDAIGAHEITIARLATGKMELTQNWMKKLARIFKIEPVEIISRPPSGLRRIRVKGWVAAGTWVDGHQWPEDEHYDVYIPDAADLRQTFLYAAEIRGESMNSRYPNKSVVVLSTIEQAPDAIAIGQRYHVRQTRNDGAIEETIKTLVKDPSGRYWLKPESTDPQFQEWIPLEGKPGATIELIGRVRFAVQREG